MTIGPKRVAPKLVTAALSAKLSLLSVLSLSLFASALPAAVERGADTLAWPEHQRAFLEDGPGLLLDSAQRQRLLGLDAAGREQLMASFLADPLPETPANEVREAIARRQALVGQEFMSLLDERARLLFLHGPPAERLVVDCDQTFKPLEVWTYSAIPRRLVLYQDEAATPYRLWLPIDSKRALYRPEMEYWLDQYHELRQFLSGRRFDLQLCRSTKLIDEVTGVGGLLEYREDRPSNEELQQALAPPSDLAAWIRAAAATDLEAVALELPLGLVTAGFPARDGQRIVTRLTLSVPAGAGVEPFRDDSTPPEYRIQVVGMVEHDGRVFEQFRLRFVVPARAAADAESDPLALVLDRSLRPGLSYLIRLRVEDEIGKRVAVLNRAVMVPTEPVAVAEVPVPADTIVALGDRLEATRVPGRDGLVLVPPESDLVFGLWRAEVLVSGERIVEVRFLVDEKLQFTRKRPPFTAELGLTTFPSEQVVRIEGYDKDQGLVAADEIVLNQQRGELRVRITAPPRGGKETGTVEAAAEVVVPEESRLTKVEFRVNGVVQAVVEQPPWRAQIEVPPQAGPEDVTYLTVVAELESGASAEDVRFLHVPSYMDEVEVDLVELYTTVTDRSNRPAQGLGVEQFQILEDGRKQKISRFELVEDLPLTIGITIDTSGSMIEALGEARRAAIDFLSQIVTPRDRSFAVRFSDRPELMMPRTSDVGAVAQTLEGLVASGSTALHDAIVTSLYYFRGVRGRRALVLLSDGDDTSSTIPFREALEYARRSGVAIYTIGLGIGRLELGVRNKLSELSQETGGRVFFVGKASELEGVYDEIEKELRSQYLLAYSSDRPGAGESDFRTVEVKVGGGNKARTISGYYP